jgi:hypothetical protein
MVRRVALLAVGLSCLGLTILVCYNVLSTTLTPPLTATPLGCADGARQLYDATERARRSAANELDGERAALAKFRAALAPEWNAYGTIRARCKANGDPRGLAALRSVELLRYAEERAVRYDALDLSRLRRSTPEALAALPQPAPLAPASSP